MHPNPATGELRNGIAKVKPAHLRMIDLLLAEPELSQGALAIKMGYTQGWVSQIMNSDAFQAAFKERQQELINPILVKSIEERLRAVANRSLDLLSEKIEHSNKISELVSVAEMATNRLGMGGGGQNSGGVQVAVVVQVPEKNKDPQAWAAQYAPPALPVVEEVAVVNTTVGVDHEQTRVFD